MLTSWTKLLAVLTLGSTITLGACAMDDADSGEDTQQSTDIADTTTPPSSPTPEGVIPTVNALPPGTTNYIINMWPTGNLGVIQSNDGSFKINNKYDAVLQPNQVTVNGPLYWKTTAGWFTGTGWCSNYQRSDDRGVSWGKPVHIGSGQHFIGKNSSYIVTPVPCS